MASFQFVEPLKEAESRRSTVLMVDLGHEGVDAVLDVLGQLTYRLSSGGWDPLHLQASGVWRSSYSARLARSWFAFAPIWAWRTCRSAVWWAWTGAASTPPWRRSTEQPPPLLCCWMLCVVICESKQVMQWPSGCITNQNVKLVFVFKTSRLWFIDKSRFRWDKFKWQQNMCAWYKQKRNMCPLQANVNVPSLYWKLIRILQPVATTAKQICNPEQRRKHEVPQQFFYWTSR